MGRGWSGRAAQLVPSRTRPSKRRPDVSTWEHSDAKAARNVAGHMQRPESELSGMMKMHALAATYQRNGQQVDWAEVRRIVERTRPPYAAYTDALAAFIATRSGGLDAPYLHYMKGFHNLMCNPSVRGSLPPALYKALADFPHHYVAVAIWQAAYSCPKAGIKEKVCCWISAAEVSALANPKASVPDKLKLIAVERMLAAFRAAYAATGIPGKIEDNNKLITLFAKVDISVARLLLGKPPLDDGCLRGFKDMPGFLSRGLLAEHRDADTTAFHAVVLPADVPSDLSAAASASIVAPPVLELYTVAASGETVHGRAQLRAQGFDNGAVVTKAAPQLGQDGAGKQHFRIAAVQEASANEPAVEATVVLQGLGDAKGEECVVCVSRFLVEYVLAAEKDVVERIAAWPAKRVASLPEAAVFRVKGLILSAMGAMMELTAARCDPIALVDLYSKPGRRATASVPIPAGNLLLLPETCTVKESDRTGPVLCGFDAAGALEVKVLVRVRAETWATPVENKMFTLVPATSEKAVAPLWFVTHVTDQASANMAWEWVDIHNISAVDSANLPPAKARRLKKGDMPASSKDLVIDHTVHFPVLVNTRDLQPGEELKCYKPKAEAPARTTKPITATQLAKPLAK